MLSCFVWKLSNIGLGKGEKGVKRQFVLARYDIISLMPNVRNKLITFCIILSKVVWPFFAFSAFLAFQPFSSFYPPNTPAILSTWSNMGRRSLAWRPISRPRFAAWRLILIISEKGWIFNKSISAINVVVSVNKTKSGPFAKSQARRFLIFFFYFILIISKETTRNLYCDHWKWKVHDRIERFAFRRLAFLNHTKFAKE